MVFDRAKEVTGWARVVGEVMWRSGNVGKTRPRALAEGAWLLGRGRAGISTVFRVRALDEPDATALTFEGERRTFREVDDRIDRLATGLRRRGIGRRDAVCIVLHNRPEFFELEGAMARLGGAAVSVSWRSTPAELAYLFRHSGARAVFFEHDLLPAVDAAQRQAPALPSRNLFSVGGRVTGFESIDDVLATRPDRDLDGEEGKVVIYTSGTTGKPKGAVRGFGAAAVLGYIAFLERASLKRGDVHLCVCPLYHSTGLGFASIALMMGGRVVIHRDFHPERFLDAVAEERVHTAAIVPTMLHRLMALDDAAFRARDLSSLRAVLCGGAQLPPTLCARALDRLGPTLYNFYGATETGLVTTATPDDLRAVPGTVGRALHGVSIKLLDEEGREVPRGQPGELFAKNLMLVDGYHADDEATRSSYRDGHFSVGDLATVDEAGRYMIVGRRRDMVISGGMNIYPVEVEAVVESHPDVAQVAVVGVPDEEWGERLRAFVVLRGGAELPEQQAAELKSWCRDRLAGPKVPREWVFLDGLPANPTGKVLKRELRAWDGPVTRV
ncbi:MAG: AMP-binding protein [Polyangiales bacterium]